MHRGTNYGTVSSFYFCNLCDTFIICTISIIFILHFLRKCVSLPSRGKKHLPLAWLEHTVVQNGLFTFSVESRSRQLASCKMATLGVRRSRRVKCERVMLKIARNFFVKSPSGQDRSWKSATKRSKRVVRPCNKISSNASDSLEAYSKEQPYLF